MFFKAIFSIIFFLQCLSPIPAKRSIIEVLHVNQDYGPVSFLSPTNGIFEYSLESPFGNEMMADEYLVNQAHLNLLTIGSQGRHLLRYQVINGTCSIHAYKNQHIRLGTYIYSKETSSVVRQAVGNTKFGALKVVSSDSANGIIHVLEKPALTDNLPLFLGMTAHKLLNEMNTSLLYETNLGPFLNSVVKDAISEQSLDKDALVQYGLTKTVMTAVSGIIDFEFIKELQRSFHKLLDASIFKNFLVDQQLNHKLKTTMNLLLSKILRLYDFPEIVPRSTLFSRFLKYITWIFKGLQCLFGFITHFRFISGAFSTLAIRPALLSWTQRTLEKREQQVMERREYRRQKRENWIAMKSSSPHTLSP